MINDLKIKLEIACSNVESVQIAVQGGADRIELFENLPEGGCTPSFGTIKKSLELCKNAGIPLMVLVRPRSGSFEYSPLEIDVIKEDLLQLQELGVDGIVSGFLNSDHQIDYHQLNWLKKMWPGKITFHRAFDAFMQHHTEDAWKGAIQELTSMGIERILSSGGKPTAIEGADNLKKLIEWSENKIQIMPGSGINSENVATLIQRTKATEIHATAKKLMTYQPVGSSSYHQADLLEIQKIKAAISAI